MAVEAPMEFLDLADGESRTFRVLRAERGTAMITPAGSGAPKEIPVVRLHVAPQDKPAGPPYVDVSSRTLQAQLAAAVDRPGLLPRIFTFTARGVAPAKRYEVASGPIQEGARS